MMKSFKYIGLVLIVFLLASCSAQATQSNQETITITDQQGDVEVVKNPKRIVTFDYAVVDFLMAMDIQLETLGAVESNAPNYQKEYLSSAQEIGGLKAPDLEKIAEIAPDVIFIGGRTIDFIEELEKIAPVVYLTTDNANLYESIKSNTQVYAQIFDVQEKANEHVSKLDELVNSIEKQTEEVLVLMYNEGVLSNFGPGSRFGFIFDLFGYQPLDPNIEVSTHGVEVSYEYIASVNPQKIFVVNRNMIHGGNVDIDTFYTHPLLENLNLEVIELDPNTIYQAAGGILSFEKTVKEILNAQ